MSNENARRRFQSQQIILAAAVAAMTSGASIAMAQVPVIDGTRDALYGSPFATQTVQTGFGDNQSELDAGYSYIKNGKLHLFLSGNLESNFNKMVIFFDTRSGGQNVMRNDNPNVDFDNLNHRYAGMTFDAGFSPDYTLFYSRDAGNVYINYSELNTNGGGYGDFIGQVATPNASQQGAGTIGGLRGAPRIDFGYSDANTAGVTGGSAAADQTAAAAVATGSEIAIDLSQIGATENFKMMIGINGSSHDFWSNQFLPGLTPPQANLGSDGMGNFVEPGGPGTGGTVGLVNFETMVPGNQWLTINYHAALSQWSSPGDGNWLDATRWIGDGVPNAPDARAILGTGGTAGTGPHTITLNGPVALQSITFDSPGTYTVAGSGANTLTISGNPATPSVVVNQGNHVISAPLVLAATTNFGIAAGSSLNVTGALTATDQVIVKTGDGLLTVPNLRAHIVSAQAGTVRVAANGTNTGVSDVNGLTFAGGFATPTAKIDLTNNDLVVRNNAVENTGTLYTNVTSAIVAARNGGNWTGNGLTSSTAAASTPKNKTLGTLTGTQYHTAAPGAQFDGLTVADTDVLVKFTWYGDTDLNGVVNFDDYSRTDAGFNNGSTGWFNGDFDYNGTVNFDDYSLIDLAFNTQSGTLRQALAYLDGNDRNRDNMNTPELRMVMQHFDELGLPYAQSFLSAVPEPTSASLLLLSALAATKRRRRAR